MPIDVLGLFKDIEKLNEALKVAKLHLEIISKTFDKTQDHCQIAREALDEISEIEEGTIYV